MPMYLIMKDSEPFRLMNDKEKAIDHICMDAAIELESDLCSYEILEVEVDQKIDLENTVPLPENNE